MCITYQPHLYHTMNLVKKIVTVASFSVLFLIVVVPLGTLIRIIADPLKLRKNVNRDSYFNLG